MKRTKINKSYVELVKVSKQIPSFINTTSEEHKDCFDITKDILIEIGKLCVNNCLSNTEIEYIVEDVWNIEYRFDAEYNISLILLCCNHIIDIEKKLLKIAIDNEEYETAENIKKYNEIYERINR